MQNDNILKKKSFLEYAQHMPGGFFVYRADGNEEILFANDKLLHLLEYDGFEDFMASTGGSFRGLVHPDDLKRIEEQIVTQVEDSDNENFDYVQYRVRTKSGRLIYIEDFGRLVHDAELGDLFFVFVVSLQEKRQNEEVDFLTGLWGRARFQENAGVMMEEMRQTGTPAMVWFDVENFKGFNENLGFQRGSDFLREMANAITSAFPDNMAARFADDHFAVLTMRAGVENRISKVQNRLSAQYQHVALKIRAGIYLPVEADSPAVACDRAKLACDGMRKNYALNYRFYDSSISAKLTLQQYIVSLLDTAVENGDIKVYYQPIVRTLTGHICETEALVRWVDPQRGILSPGDFIETLEQYHAIHKLDLCMLRRICADYQKQKARGGCMLPTSLNLSRLDFELCDIFQEVDRTMAEYGVPKDMLKLEITESIQAENVKLMNEGIEKFKANGYEVWLDDFGSGYSSLNILKEYNFDTIKFDMRFLRDFNQKSQFILSSNLTMAKQMGIQALAEGVEDMEQLTFLKSIGFDKAQGYLFSKPMPLEDILALPLPKEDHEEYAYYNKLSRVEIPNQTFMERDGYAVADVRGMALLEILNGRASYLAMNDIYRHWMITIGVTSVETADEVFSNRYGELQNRFRESAERLRGGKGTESFHIFLNGNCILVRVAFIASNPCTGADAYVIMHTDATRFPRRTLDKDLKQWMHGVFDDVLDVDMAAQGNACRR